VGCAALREFSDDAVRSAERLETATSLPVLTAIAVVPTAAEIRRRRVRRLAWAAGAAGGLAAAVLTLHFAVMDLEVVWIKVARKLGI
jgi:ferric-dicitrate binding protein FerR (iron transport regulator)